MVKKTNKTDSKKIVNKKPAVKSAAGDDVRKRRKKSRAPPVKGLRYKLAVTRILRGSGVSNPMRADSYKVLDQMFSEIPRNVMIQVGIQASALTRKKQKKQRGLKAIHVINAVQQLLPNNDARADYLGFVQDRLRQYHTVAAE